ncbi:hypothetical protein FRY98_11720 [Paenibacillus faecis]|uniref:Uncharacterized protein n=1 Tax=Paenibacillus faecis TaxID=862114 RepID=A0A5D0CXX0_9BACL|nr:hypothetical protein FRY98_11720 [Paenibacillus faecis]
MGWPHGFLVHVCTLGQGTLIGMGAIVLNGAEIGEYALVGAGYFDTENKKSTLYSFPGTSGKEYRITKQ